VHEQIHHSNGCTKPTLLHLRSNRGKYLSAAIDFLAKARRMRHPKRSIWVGECVITQSMALAKNFPDKFWMLRCTFSDEKKGGMYLVLR